MFYLPEDMFCLPEASFWGRDDPKESLPKGCLVQRTPSERYGTFGMGREYFGLEEETFLAAFLQFK